MTARAPPAPAPSALHARVEHVVHAAFWDEYSLCSPKPAVQLPCLKLLYTDFWNALVRLFLPNRTLLTILAAPLPPTSSPLHSTLTLLQDILRSLLHCRAQPATPQSTHFSPISLPHPKMPSQNS
ncbi:hypothetical protein DXG01_003846 [Tephrocybe rancida]|nr:hypothetical protein DXG01_003846 [Tephrocybe rancida]